MIREGKSKTLQLQNGDDTQEGAITPVRLLDINGDPIETAGGGGYNLVLSIAFASTSNPTITEIVNDTGATYSIVRNGVGTYLLSASSDVLGDNPSFFFSQLTVAGNYFFSTLYAPPNFAISIANSAGTNTDVTGNMVFSLTIND